MCFKEFETWVNALRTHGHRVRWIFSTSDCRRLNTDGKKFDVITTSNVSDHMGLMNLLGVCKGLLKDYGVLETLSLTWHLSAKDRVEYIKNELHNSKKKWSHITT